MKDSNVTIGGGGEGACAGARINQNKKIRKKQKSRYRINQTGK